MCAKEEATTASPGTEHNLRHIKRDCSDIDSLFWGWGGILIDI